MVLRDICVDWRNCCGSACVAELGLARACVPAAMPSLSLQFLFCISLKLCPAVLLLTQLLLLLLLLLCHPCCRVAAAAAGAAGRDEAAPDRVLQGPHAGAA
jgi:hypothetical protein